PIAQRNSAVGIELVQIEEHVFAAAFVLPKDQRLLQPRAMTLVKNPTSFPLRRGHVVDINQSVQLVEDLVSPAKPAQKFSSGAVLGAHPTPDFSGATVFEPAIRVRNRRSEARFRDRLPARGDRSGPFYTQR